MGSLSNTDPELQTGRENDYYVDGSLYQLAPWIVPLWPPKKLHEDMKLCRSMEMVPVKDKTTDEPLHLLSMKIPEKEILSREKTKQLKNTDFFSKKLYECDEEHQNFNQKISF